MFTHTRQGTVDVIGGSKPLVSTTVEELQSLLDECLQKGAPRIVISLDEVPLIDSEGLELLLNTNDRCTSRGGVMLLAAPNALCRDILRMTGIDQSISMYSDATDAIRSFSR